MAINVKRIDLVQRFKDRDVLKAPRTILDQVYINDTQKDDGTVEKGIEDTPAFIYNGKKPNNLNEALKNLAENVKGSIGASGVLQIKRGAAGTPEDPDLSGIYTMPEAGETYLGIVTLAKIKDLADEVDAAKDATRATVANKILTGVKADGTGEYYDLGTQMKNPASNKAFQGFEGGDITKPMWLEVKSTVAPAPFTGSTTIAGETYSSSDIGVASEFFYKLFKGNQLAIVESDSLTPTSDNKYYAEWGGGANDAVTITIPKAEGKVKDVQINNTSIVDTDGNAKITVKDTYDAAGTDAISGKGVADALSNLELEETGGTDKIITMVKQEDGKVTATAKTAVEKVTTPATTNAYEYKIADASVKVELPKATDTVYGEILLDKNKIDSASTAKTDDPKLMTGKAIEDSLVWKKVNESNSIYTYHATKPTEDSAIVGGDGASGSYGSVVLGTQASQGGEGVAIGKEAYSDYYGIAIGTESKAYGSNDGIAIAIGGQSYDHSVAISGYTYEGARSAVAIQASVDTDAKGSIAIGNMSSVGGKASNSVALGQYCQVSSRWDEEAQTTIPSDFSTAIGYASACKASNAVAIGKLSTVNDNAKGSLAMMGATADAENDIVIGANATATAADSIAIGVFASASNQEATAIGYNANAVNIGQVGLGGCMSHQKDYDGRHDPDNTNFCVGQADGNSNIIEIMQSGECYLPNIGGYDGSNVNSTNVKKVVNPDTGVEEDYINPLTNKTEKIVKPLQDVIELMDARIKYLEDVIEQLTQQRNPVEP